MQPLETGSHTLRPRPALKTIREIGTNTFIFERRQALPSAVCEDMIRRFELHAEEQYEGRIGQIAYQDQNVQKKLYFGPSDYGSSSFRRSECTIVV